MLKSFINGGKLPVIATMWVPFVLTLVLLVLAYHSMELRDNTATWMDQTYVVKDALDQVSSTNRDLESATREYGATHNPDSVLVIKNIATQFLASVDNVAKIAEDHSVQSLGTSHLRILVSKILEDNNHIIQALDAKTADEPITLITANTIPLKRALNTQISTMKAEEDRLYSERQHGLSLELNYQESWMFCIFALDLFIILVATWFMHHFYTLREKARHELETAHKSAEASNLAKTQFLANMSHEIRTPLNGIIGTTDLMFTTPLNKEQRDYIETIHNSGDNLLTLVNDILDYSKAEFDKLELESRQFNLLDILNDVVGTLSYRAQEKKLNLVYSVDPGLPVTYIGDELRVKQILTNLGSNAIKFTKEGTVKIEVSSTKALTDSHRPQLSIAITDTGIGIPPDRLGKLFQVFTQVDASTTRNYGGSGLGLAICQKLVGLMNGELNVESVVGKGSKFTVILPLSPGEAERNDYTNKALSGRQVLVLADQTTRRMLELLMTRWNIITTEAASLAEAAILVKGQAYDAIIIDLGSEDMTLTQKLLIPVNASTPFIYLTSEQQEDTKLNYITKPIRQSLLKSTLMELITKAPKIQTLVNTRSTQRLLNILIADDNELNQRVNKNIFSRLGYSPKQAMDGTEVLECLKAMSYDIIFMDVQMPILDGLETTRRIRQLPSCRQIKIIALTANALKGEREKCIEAGMDDYLSKPVKIDAIKAVLAKYT